MTLLTVTRRLALSVALAAGAFAYASAPAAAQTADERAVRAVVERFLDVLGTRQLDALPALLAPNANTAVARLRDGAWSYTTQTADQWLASLKAQKTPVQFREPLTNVVVHVADGHLAFVRGDFTVVIDGQVRSHGVDYFTLVNDAGAWKLIHLSYTSKNGPPPR